MKGLQRNRSVTARRRFASATDLQKALDRIQDLAQQKVANLASPEARNRLYRLGVFDGLTASRAGFAFIGARLLGGNGVTGLQPGDRVGVPWLGWTATRQPARCSTEIRPLQAGN